MANISGTNLAAAIVPFTTEDKFATHLSKYGKGGWREVTSSSELDTITADRREAGMAVYVTSEKSVYILSDDLTTWTLLELGKVDDVQVKVNDDSDFTSVVENKIAKIDLSSINKDIEDIQEVIPTQATKENQLADKSFVNSSIATSTADFIGTFDSLEELQNYSGLITNNDYAFVVTKDDVGNLLYNRYKYTDATTPASWKFEYTLNNSAFTADQWASINSGSTDALIKQITTNKTNINNHVTNKSNPHEVTKTQIGLGNVDNTSDLNKPISTATQNALDLKQDNLTAGYNMSIDNNVINTSTTRIIVRKW